MRLISVMAMLSIMSFVVNVNAKNCPDGQPNTATITGPVLVAKMTGLPITAGYTASARCGLPIMYAWNKPQSGVSLASCYYTWSTLGTKSVSCTISTFSYGGVTGSLSVLVGTATYRHATGSPGSIQDGDYITHIAVNIGPGESREFSKGVTVSVGCNLSFGSYVNLQASDTTEYTASATISYPPAPIGDGVSAVTGHCDVYQSRRSVSIEQLVDGQLNATQTGWDYSPYANVKAVIWD